MTFVTHRGRKNTDTVSNDHNCDLPPPRNSYKDRSWPNQKIIIAEEKLSKVHGGRRRGRQRKR